MTSCCAARRTRASAFTFRPFTALLVLWTLAAVAAPAAAQTPPVAPAPVTGGWQDGFILQTANGDYRLTLGLTMQADGRFSLDTPAPFTDTFTLRKIRPTFTGRIAKYFDYKVMPDLGGGQVVMQDAYLDARFSPKFRVRVGKDKTPVGYELLIGDAYVLFPERSLATSLIPNRDNGVQVQGDLLASKLSYSAGVFNGVPDGTSSSTEVDTNNGKDLAGRIVLLPFRSRATPARPASGLGFHLGASTGKQTGTLSAFRTSATQTYFSYATGVAADGTRTRVTPAVFYYFRSFGGFAEYVRSTQSVSRAGAFTDVANHAWDVTASYVVTGDTTTDRGVRPRNNFDPAAGHWGALQLLARVAQLSVDPAVFSRNLAASTASQEAKQWSVEANWYPNYWIKYYISYEHTAFTGGTAARPAENAVILRTQFAF